MKNMNTTLEIPEGSKATIQGKVIDGKHYLVVEVENEEQKEPEWKNFKRGDVLVKPAVCKRDEIFVIFEEYMVDSNHTYFNCIFNNANDGETYWVSELFRKATDAEKARFFKWLEEEKGLEWDGEKLVEVLKQGDMAIFRDDNTEDAIISVCKRIDNNGRYVDHLGLCWDNAIKWDGTKEQYEKVLRGELK